MRVDLLYYAAFLVSNNGFCCALPAFIVFTSCFSLTYICSFKGISTLGCLKELNLSENLILEIGKSHFVLQRIFIYNLKALGIAVNICDMHIGFVEIKPKRNYLLIKSCRNIRKNFGNQVNL